MAIEREAIERQVAVIFASDAFSSAPKMRALLRYLVDATLSGDGERLKGYAIGIDVFNRGAGFDPATDPIVRVQAGRLRKMLETYYLTAGEHDLVRIEIPKGSYAVAVTGRGEREMSRPPASGRAEDDDSAEDTEADLVTGGEEDATVPAARPLAPVWPQTTRARIAFAGLAALSLLVATLGAQYLLDTRKPPASDGSTASVSRPPVDAITLAVLPFTNMSADQANVHFGHGLSDGLTTALSRVKSISLASRTSAFQYREATDLRQVGRELGVRYIVEGALQHDGERLRINVQLIDAATGAHLWAQDYDRMAGDDFALQSELVRTLAAEIRPQLYSAAKRAIEDSPGQTPTPWQLYMQATWMPGETLNSLVWEKERVALARRALALDPNLGQAHSVLADKLAFLATVDPLSDTAEARSSAGEHARRAQELAPRDADVMFNVSIYNWHAGRIAESVAATQRTLELDPNHVLARFLLKAVPYTCAEAPQEVIGSLIAFDAAMSADNPIRWVTLNWISMLYVNTGDFVHAAEAARRADGIFRTPNTVYTLAAILQQLGDTRAAVDALNQQRDNWPTLDPRHYAEVAIPRRCGNAPRADFLKRIYTELADAAQAASGGG